MLKMPCVTGFNGKISEEIYVQKINKIWLKSTEDYYNEQF